MQKMTDITGEDGDETWRDCKFDQFSKIQKRKRNVS